ncbi:alkaline phosphatase family protein [Dickeya dianthicola]|nr:alkaline phosphatase family protein [Dickeya dianthicola]MCI4002820.1 alkaline phosphatase family protein [Dickeya dianthicola]MCI4187961.1 alkaline phosphatase family protein [Dickeya dianthicola]MCI4214759.1 alkaline phosphatase family protein [Dickeya dianthicola]MCI4232028.1 alkaline phosphatase family protein [Dickeya dianthicola]
MYLSPVTGLIPDISLTRHIIRDKLYHKKAGAQQKSVIIFAVDGVPFRLAKQYWPSAPQKIMLRSLFPTTTSSVWLTIVSGDKPSIHGVPGVVFRPESNTESLINIFQYQGALGYTPQESIFSDAAKQGITPLVISGDLECHISSWQRSLLCHAHEITGFPIYQSEKYKQGKLSSRQALNTIRQAINETLNSLKEPALIWYFIDLDLHIHHHGYDPHTMAMLTGIDELAQQLTRQGLRVIAHSDHGLVETTHSEYIENVMQNAMDKYAATMGGAGRTRWLYTRQYQDAFRFLRQALPADILLAKKPQSPTASPNLFTDRLGDIIMISRGNTFICPPSYHYEHGSLTIDEVFVPLFFWHRE